MVTTYYLSAGRGFYDRGADSRTKRSGGRVGDMQVGGVLAGPNKDPYGQRPWIGSLTCS